MSSREEVDYDALEATTKIEDITNDDIKQGTLRSLRDDDGDLSHLWIRVGEEAYDHGEYHPESSEELGWLGHFVKKSTRLEWFGIYGGDIDIFHNCSEQSVDRFLDDLRKCNHIRKFHFIGNGLAEIIYKLGPAMKSNNITHLSVGGCCLGVPEATFLFNTLRDMNSLEELCIDCEEVEDLANLECRQHCSVHPIARNLQGYANVETEWSEFEHQ
ncbi:hypothetical protein THAOC_03896 [Thalassiosira oceanica]|uniref:Uncharacterized protein n=1 Tax=Thalassiosira oceanica TaxID=159749 RepID=K0T6J7_THAOC|nr:hypothetical protein THAOC_03896 [Thalassiosira oceanica]|eukprot:EJK74423.1 hypothetical protein THAOC_03896 [Thalassiosira oceanica]